MLGVWAREGCRWRGLSIALLAEPHVARTGCNSITALGVTVGYWWHSLFCLVRLLFLLCCVYKHLVDSKSLETQRKQEQNQGAIRRSLCLPVVTFKTN